MDENIEVSDLVIKRKKYSYMLLILVFVLSVAGSNWYFNSLKASNANALSGDSIVSSGEFVFNFASGEKIEQEDKEIENQIEKEDDIKSGIENNIENTIQDTTEDVEQKDEEEIIIDKVISSVNNRTIDPEKPMVALTFDDGPDPKRTIKMLEILEKHNAVATFFDIGNLMEKYPEVVQKEIEAGCDVGGHTYSHVNLNSLSKDEVKKDVNNLKNAYAEATGLELKYIRPTYGNANSMVRSVIDTPIINWCVDSLDWKHRNADKVIEEIMNTSNFDGKIILMHVIYDSTIEAVDRLIPMLIEDGYQIVTITEMAEAKGYDLQDGKIYYQF